MIAFLYKRDFCWIGDGYADNGDQHKALVCRWYVVAVIDAGELTVVEVGPNAVICRGWKSRGLPWRDRRGRIAGHGTEPMLTLTVVCDAQPSRLRHLPEREAEMHPQRFVRRAQREGVPES